MPVSASGLILTLLLTACGAPSGSTADSSIAPPPSPDPYTSALIMTRTWAAAEMEIDVRATVDGRRLDLDGTGEVAIDKGYADIEWTSGDTHSRELVNDRAIFTQVDAPSGVWTRTESNGRTPTSAFANPLLNLTRLEGVAPDGSEDTNGFDATRYRGTLPITADNLEGLALTDGDVARVVAAAGSTDAIVVTVWVDPNHRLVRIDRNLDVDSTQLDASVLASTHLSNFGVMLDLESPPSASVSALR